MELTCKKCGCINEPITSEKTFKNGTTHTEARCKHCNQFLQYLAHDPNPLELIPFGKYKGRSIMSIAHEDYDYALWASENLESKRYREAFILAMEAL
jgi:hypothetical protein